MLKEVASWNGLIRGASGAVEWWRWYGYCIDGDGLAGIAADVDGLRTDNCSWNAERSVASVMLLPRSIRRPVTVTWQASVGRST